MKKIFLPLASLALLTSVGCTEQDAPQAEVSVTLDYSFVESGSMTRAGDKVYTDFYETYVKTKVLTPKTFNLTFTNVETGAETIINGEWTKNHSLKLLTGEYNVVGTSYPPSSYSKACVDSLYLRFDETIKITDETTSINLTAQHDSYLLMFDKSDKISILYDYGSTSHSTTANVYLKTINNLYYAFLNKKQGNTYNTIFINREVERTTIDLHKIPFEKGKYYYFNDLSNSFDIPPMTSGN